MDGELWRLIRKTAPIICYVREIHDRSQPWGNTFIGWELRVDHGGELKRSEVFRDRDALEDKEEKSFESLGDFCPNHDRLEGEVRGVRDGSVCGQPDRDAPLTSDVSERS